MKPTDSQEKPVFTLITGGSVYAPDKLGRKEILIAGRVIARIAQQAGNQRRLDFAAGNPAGFFNRRAQLLAVQARREVPVAP